jgi:hypothetical protein
VGSHMTDFPIETQAAFAITAGLCAWLIGALMREIAHKPWEAWTGRIVVGVGVLQLAAFAGRAANQVEFLQFVQRGERAHDTGSQVIEYTTDGGQPFRFGGGKRGRSTTGIGYTSAVLPTMGRTSGSGARCGCCSCDSGRTCNCNEGLCTEPQQTSPALASTSPRRRVCICERCTCSPCLCNELQAATNR